MGSTLAVARSYHQWPAGSCKPGSLFAGGAGAGLSRAPSSRRWLALLLAFACAYLASIPGAGSHCARRRIALLLIGREKVASAAATGTRNTSQALDSRSLNVFAYRCDVPSFPSLRAVSIFVSLKTFQPMIRGLYNPKTSGNSKPMLTAKILYDQDGRMVCESTPASPATVGWPSFFLGGTATNPLEGVSNG